MAFDLHGPTRTVQIDSEHEALFELPARYGEPVAFLPQLRQKFYQDSILGADSVAQFRGELARVLQRRRDDLEPKVVAARKIYAQDASVREVLLLRVLRQDPLYAKLEEIIALCDDCMAQHADLRCAGD